MNMKTAILAAAMLALATPAGAVEQAATLDNLRNTACRGVTAAVEMAEMQHTDVNAAIARAARALRVRAFFPSFDYGRDCLM
jgi:hypothetical protein